MKHSMRTLSYHGEACLPGLQFDSDKIREVSVPDFSGITGLGQQLLEQVVGLKVGLQRCWLNRSGNLSVLPKPPGEGGRWLRGVIF